MTRETQRTFATALRVGTALLSAVLLPSCSGPTAPSAEPSPTASTAIAPTTAASPSTSTEASPAKKRSRAPEPGDLATPATRSGPLSRSTFPHPRSLGARWAYAVDPGDAEEGYLGNGTPALERDPAEVTLASVPMGCPRPHRLPRPAHALEVDYTRSHTKVIAIRARFDGAGEAGRFFDQRANTISACRGRSGGPAIGTLVDSVSRPSDGVLLSDRTPRSDPWT
ncbi:MAG: hypothetical protein ACTHKG_14530, partial [Nocardioides sp.]